MSKMIRTRSALEHFASGRLPEAAEVCKEILSEQPDEPDALHVLGLVQLQSGKHREAIACLRRALDLRPEDAHYAYNLGLAWQNSGQTDEAMLCYEKAAMLQPDFFQAHDNLGTLHQEKGQFEIARRLHERALSCKPDHIPALSNLGMALQECGEIEGALSCYEKALSLVPDHPELINNMGYALEQKGRPDEALAFYLKALVLKPDYAKARFNLSLMLLLSGNYGQGFELYESRFNGNREMSGSRKVLESLSGISQWRGENLEGKRILIWADQGLGDMLMMLRYLPLMKGEIAVSCDPALNRLVEGMKGVSIVDDSMRMECFDFHSPVMSLPLAFGTDIDTIPSIFPYISVPENMKQSWAEKFAGMRGSRVGLVWAGGKRLRRDALRSMPPESMKPLLDLKGAHYFSLQKGEAESGPRPFSIVDWMGECQDMLDTAAFIMNLDLVISVDTSVAHLAGALGKDVWLLNRFESEWRWMTDRDDSPWYPKMRIFRQDRPGDWKGVIAKAASALDAMLNRQDA